MPFGTSLSYNGWQSGRALHRPERQRLLGVALAEDQNGDRIVLASDRDFGLFIFRYTGDLPT
jgi:hypothetical protein